MRVWNGCASLPWRSKHKPQEVLETESDQASEDRGHGPGLTLSSQGTSVQSLSWIEMQLPHQHNGNYNPSRHPFLGRLRKKAEGGQALAVVQVL